MSPVSPSSSQRQDRHVDGQWNGSKAEQYDCWNAAGQANDHASSYRLLVTSLGVLYRRACSNPQRQSNRSRHGVYVGLKLGAGCLVGQRRNPEQYLGYNPSNRWPHNRLQKLVCIERQCAFSSRLANALGDCVYMEHEKTKSQGIKEYAGSFTRASV